MSRYRLYYLKLAVYFGNQGFETWSAVQILRSQVCSKTRNAQQLPCQDDRLVLKQKDSKGDKKDCRRKRENYYTMPELLGFRSSSCRASTAQGGAAKILGSANPAENPSKKSHFSSFCNSHEQTVALPNTSKANRS